MAVRTVVLTFVLELVSHADVLGLVRQSPALYAWALWMNCVNNLALGPATYWIAVEYFCASKPSESLLELTLSTSAVVCVHAVGYYAAHKSMHSKRLQKAASDRGACSHTRKGPSKRRLEKTPRKDASKTAPGANLSRGPSLWSLANSPEERAPRKGPPVGRRYEMIPGAQDGSTSKRRCFEIAPRDGACGMPLEAAPQNGLFPTAPRNGPFKRPLETTTEAAARNAAWLHHAGSRTPASGPPGKWSLHGLVLWRSGRRNMAAKSASRTVFPEPSFRRGSGKTVLGKRAVPESDFDAVWAATPWPGEAEPEWRGLFKGVLKEALRATFAFGRARGRQRG
ncbi:hypothetical protein M885DRAFT_2315 [Pelagophyceae sp. CCMP2097]|nr:hypothetical protein M885DRAFT_2315 [Pelagophyceae sp. CCMP2097]